MSQLLSDPLENASELLEAANSLQGPSPFPAPAPTPVVPVTNAISGTAPNPTNENRNIEFDFRSYLDNQYFEPGSHDDQVELRSSTESFLPPQDFERLFSNPVRPSLCPSMLAYVPDMMQDYPLELLELPVDMAIARSSGSVA